MSLCNTSILPFLVCFGVLLTSTYAASLVPPQTPTTVFVKLYINQLNKIDGVEQTFSSDFYMTSYWEDSRITGDEYDPVVDWNPQLEFSNVLGSATETISDPYLVLTNDEIDDTLASLSTSGVPRENQTWIKTDQRYIGDFLTVLNLRDFPFDKQNAIIKIESALFNNKIVSIKPYPTMMEGNVSAHILPKDFEVTEWDLEWEEGPVSITTTEHFYPVFDETYSQLRLDVALQRQHTYYMLKIVTGVILLVYMCIMVIALAVEEPDRMMGTLTVFLALVSFTFITGSDVPKVAYSTRIDTFILFSFFITFVMMTEHCVNYLIHEYLGEDDEHTSKADVLDRVNSKGLSGASRFMAKVRHRYSGIRTRKIDGLFAIVVSITYAIGTAIIFGQPVQQRV